eukprot:scaffold13383_cov310-Alexandrium_tamarense.AAC.1
MRAAWTGSWPAAEAVSSLVELWKSSGSLEHWLCFGEEKRWQEGFADKHKAKQRTQTMRVQVHLRAEKLGNIARGRWRGKKSNPYAKVTFVGGNGAGTSVALVDLGSTEV